VLVAGAGLAGLTAAYDLVAMGADVTVIDARDRVGGRVWTARNGFTDSQHGEAGGEMIDEAQHEIRQLSEELGLKLVRILRSGFGYARTGRDGRVRIARGSSALGWERLANRLAELTRLYRFAERRWDTPIATELAKRSVAEWLEQIQADDELRATALGLRGFFLADPEELSLLALVDQFSEDEKPRFGPMYRIVGGNDRLPSALAHRLGERVRLKTELVSVSHRGRAVRAGVKRDRRQAQMHSDYLILALPATLLRRIPITPALPAQQHDAIARLKYGRGTKTLLQFSQRFWRAPGLPRAFGSSMAFGAVWDGNEEQRGRAGILALLAGGTASDQTADIAAREGAAGLARSLDWLGARNANVVACHQTAWETDPWSRGGYAAFDSSFDPSLRAWLARPFGRLFFAGEHTSIQWQGYMNGAVESGRRAAAEVAATHRLGVTS
jgi:monoamine oxidase